MSTQELHIHLDLLLQKVNSNWNKNFLPQEKDVLINKEITKFIKQRINPLSNGKKLSVFDILKRTQDLNLLVKTVDVAIVNLNTKEATYQLPFDFLGYINSDVNITPTCDINTKVPVNKIKYFKSIKPVSIFNTLTAVTLKLIIGNQVTTLFDLATLPSDYLPQDNIQDYRKVFIINNAMNISILNHIPANIEYKYNNQSNLFEFKSSIPFTLIYSINSATQSINNITISDLGYAETSTLVSPVRISDEEFRSELNNSSLSSSKDETLIGYLRNDNVILPKVKNLVMNNGTLTYFCKPRKVDILLGNNSNFSDEILDEVISNTAQTIKGIISSDTYDKFAQENTLIE